MQHFEHSMIQYIYIYIEHMHSQRAESGERRILWGVSSMFSNESIVIDASDAEKGIDVWHLWSSTMKVSAEF